MTGADTLLDVEDLQVEARVGRENRIILNDVSLNVGLCEIVGVVGES